MVYVARCTGYKKRVREIIMLIKINKNQSGLKLDKFLISKYPDIINKDIYNFIKKKDIKVNDKKVKNNYILKVGDIINISNFSLKVLENPKNKRETKFCTVDEKYIKLFKNLTIYEDENILAINKPYDISVQGGTNIDISVADIISSINKSENTTLKLVHRIDKTTTGILIIAKNLESANELTGLFKNKNKIEKYYLALCVGKFNNENGTINIPLTKKNNSDIVFKDEKNGKEAITKYEVIKYSSEHNISFVKLQILTGRTHQIRAHLKEIGHPILGDFKYNKSKNNFISSNRLQLHSYQIKLNLFGKKIDITANIPEKMLNVIEKTM